MSKTTKILIGVVIIIAVVAIVAVVFMKPVEEQPNDIQNNTGVENNTVTEEIENNNVSLPEINTEEDLSALVDSIYEGMEEELPALQTQVIDVSDNDMVKYVTGLDNANDVEFVVASEPLMSSQAYSLVLVKVRDGVNVEQIAKTMNEKINARKWVCVTAEKVYTTSSKDIVCLVMSNEETAKTIYEKFKTLAGSIGQEYERTEAEPELPEDMY